MELERQEPMPITWGNDPNWENNPNWDAPMIQNHFREIIVIRKLNN